MNCHIGTATLRQAEASSKERAKALAAAFGDARYEPFADPQDISTVLK